MTTGDLEKYLPSDGSPEINFNLEGFNTHYPGIARPEITLVAISSVFPPILSRIHHYPSLSRSDETLAVNEVLSPRA